jgi:choline dehydrogenase-like flavoprotein
VAAHRTYDYVIVGAGSAGCVLAARLSEDAQRRVLVLEAGGDDNADEIKIPAAFATLFRTQYDWSFTTVEQKHVLGRRMEWPRGKVVGGSSSVNAMLYIRGNRLDYDTWRDVYGCAGWGFDDLLPYFKKAEDNARGASDYHGTGGPLRVEDLRSVHELSHAFVESAVAQGIKRNDDFNGAEQEGVGLFQVTQRGGRRWSAADAYLRPALGRPNVDLVTDALVTRVVVEGGRAVGVEYLAQGEPYVARCDGEVLLSGGTINSPQLLMLSGVGPAPHLREHGIAVESDLVGVGANLQDHLAAGALWRTRGTTSLHDHETIGQLLKWQLLKRGPLTSPVAEACAFLRTRPELPAPDLQYHVAPVAFLDNARSEPFGRGFTVGATLVSVASRGSLRLAGPDPRWYPTIDAGYLSEEEDLESLLAGVKLARDIALGGPLPKLLDEEFLPGSAVVTDDALRDAIRANAQSLYHPVGTCSMGTGDGSVVDQELRVRGVEGLRVIDASVMPTVPRGNTNAPTIAIAERGADLIRGRTPLPASR